MRQRTEEVREQADDAELAGLAGAGDLDAFEELYRRHVGAAWRMALAVTANPHDAADAVSDAFTRVLQALPDRPQVAGHFLPYLLAAVRNAAIDGLRRGGRQRASNTGDHNDLASPSAEPGDELVADVEATLVGRAFRSLPERWRSVLWLVEVERISHRDVAVLLGLTPNGVAQLAVRARAGLRQRYLQAHIRQTEVRTSCQDTVGRLGAYAAGALAPRDTSKADQHLAGCEACRSRLSQLQDLTPCLRRAVLPLPVAMAALSAAKLHLATGGTAAGAAAATALPASVGAGVVAALAPAPLVAAFASAVLLVAGVVGVGVVERAKHRAAPVTTAAAAPPVDATFASATAPAPAPAPSRADAVAALLDEGARAAADLAGITDLISDLRRGVADLPAGAPESIAAAASGDVRVTMGPVAASIDLRDGPETCPTFRLLGAFVGCPGTATPDGDAVPVGDGLVVTPPPAPTGR